MPWIIDRVRKKSTAQITALSGLVRKIIDCESELTNYLSLHGDLLERSITVRTRLAACDRGLRNSTMAWRHCTRPARVREFSESIDLIVSSGLSNSPPVAAASAVQSLDVSDETILRMLLRATNAGAWACLGMEPDILSRKQ